AGGAEPAMSAEETMKRIAMTLLALAVAGATGTRAQDPAPAPADTPPAESGIADAGARIDEILEGEEAVLQGQSYSYDPGDRRDPFKSLETAQTRPELDANLPEGVP